jgi:hypothetical protein
MKTAKIFSPARPTPRLLFWLALGCVLSALAHAAPFVPGRTRVLAVIAGKAVSDRQVALDTFIEKPELYDGSGKLASNEVDKGLLRVLTQIMVTEEGRIIGSEAVDSKKVEAEFNKVKKNFGPRLWKDFLLRFELTENMVRERIQQKLQVERALSLRVESALATSNATPGKNSDPQDNARKAVEDWLKQLRARYRTQFFHYSDST